MTKSYCEFGPSFKVIRLVSSFDTGFSMYQDWYFISELTIDSFLDPLVFLGSVFKLKGRTCEEASSESVTFKVSGYRSNISLILYL